MRIKTFCYSLLYASQIKLQPVLKYSQSYIYELIIILILCYGKNTFFIEKALRFILEIIKKKFIEFSTKLVNLSWSVTAQANWETMNKDTAI